MTDLDRGKDFEPDIYATHEEDYDDFDVEEEEEGGSKAAIILLVVIGAVILLGSNYVTYRIAHQNGVREASLPHLQVAARGGKEQPENPGGLAAPQESALDESVTGEGDLEFDKQLLPREEEVIELPTSDESGDAMPGIEIPETLGVEDPDSEPASAPAAEKPSAPAPKKPTQTASSETSGGSKPITVPKPGGGSPSAGASSTGAAVAEVPSPSSGSEKSVPSPTPSVPAPPPSVPSPTVSSPSSSSGSAAGANTSGDYVVQLASLPSQEAAASAWRNTTSKYPDLLDGAIRDIEEADLGERGVFYRLRVGYFPSRSEANRLCETLKSRGQDCLVKSR